MGVCSPLPSAGVIPGGVQFARRAPFLLATTCPARFSFGSPCSRNLYPMSNVVSTTWTTARAPRPGSKSLPRATNPRPTYPRSRLRCLLSINLPRASLAPGTPARAATSRLCCPPLAAPTWPSASRREASLLGSNGARFGCRRRFDLNSRKTV